MPRHGFVILLLAGAGMAQDHLFPLGFANAGGPPAEGAARARTTLRSQL